MRPTHPVGPVGHQRIKTRCGHGAEPLGRAVTVANPAQVNCFGPAIRDDVRGRLRVRLLGIDTPETKRPGYGVGCWGPEATAFAESTMLGSRVALQTDPTQDRTDRCGRTLAYLVRADGFDYSVEAARAGMAKSYVYGGVPVLRHDAIDAAEAEARAAGRGLWGRPCYGDIASAPR